MANEEQLELLLSGVDSWNAWRRANPDIEPDLRGAQLRRAQLRGAQLQGVHLNSADLGSADLSRADLGSADLSRADLGSADLSSARLRRADLGLANLVKADLVKADLYRTNLGSANLSSANLRGADLSRATLVGTNLEGVDLTECRIYGISAWNIKGRPNEQTKNLVITRDNEPTVTVDELEVAQFIYLLLKNKKLRNVIDTMTSKAVLILGNFSADRKAVLEEIRNQLRERNYLPILFDFEGPENRDLVETVTTVAHLARFVIADITQARAVQDELRAIVTGVSVPIQPFIMGSECPYATFWSLYTGRTSVLKLRRYEDTKALVESFEEEIINPAEQKFRELEMERVSALVEEV